jgi:hypothetical protein
MLTVAALITGISMPVALLLAAPLTLAQVKLSAMQVESMTGALAATEVFTVGGGPEFIAYDGNNIWVTNTDSKSVSVLRASDGFPIMTPTVGANVWVANNGSNTVMKIPVPPMYYVSLPVVTK